MYALALITEISMTKYFDCLTCFVVLGNCFRQQRYKSLVYLQYLSLYFFLHQNDYITMLYKKFEKLFTFGILWDFESRKTQKSPWETLESRGFTPANT